MLSLPYYFARVIFNIFIQNYSMRLLLFIIIAFSIIACSKDNDADTPPPAIDTLKSGWKKIKISTLNQVNDIFFINNATGYAISGHSIFRSADGGNHWSEVYRSAKPLNNIAMGNENNAMFTSSSGLVYFTNNGGLNFDSTELADYRVDDAFFVSESVAYAVGVDHTWKTTNAGKSWTNLSAFISNMGDNLNALYFRDEQTGWVVGNGVFKTTNGGITWNNIPGNYAGFGHGLVNIFFPNAATGYMITSTEIYKTSDGGANFTKIFNTFNQHYPDIHFVDAQVGYITDNKYILKTIDAGQTWTKEVVLAQENLVELHFTDASHGWAGGTSGLILKYER